jgi:hypothetical protein
MEEGPITRRREALVLNKAFNTLWVGWGALAQFFPFRKAKEWEVFWIFFYVRSQHCFICRSSDSTKSEDAGIEPKTAATLALTDRRSNYTVIYHRKKAKEVVYLLVHDIEIIVAL